jgi:hypothetical protein
MWQGHERESTCGRKSGSEGKNEMGSTRYQHVASKHRQAAQVGPLYAPAASTPAVSRRCRSSHRSHSRRYTSSSRRTKVWASHSGDCRAGAAAGALGAPGPSGLRQAAAAPRVHRQPAAGQQPPAACAGAAPPAALPAAVHRRSAVLPWPRTHPLRQATREDEEADGRIQGEAAGGKRGKKSCLHLNRSAASSRRSAAQRSVRRLPHLSAPPTLPAAPQQ